MRILRQFTTTTRIERSGRNLNSLWSKLQREEFDSISTEPSTVSFQTPTTNPTDLSHNKEDKSVDTTPNNAYIYIEGVRIPKKPSQPSPEECCMSGCVNCTYDIYADDLASYLSAAPKTASELEAKGVDISRWPTDLKGFAGAKAATSQADAELEAERAADKLVSDLDPTMRAFLEVSVYYIRSHHLIGYPDGTEFEKGITFLQTR